MESSENQSDALPPDEELVEVRKPTSLLVAQFFLFPLIIIGICVGIFLLFGYLTYEQKTPADYLSDLRSGTGNQRWQAAFELSNTVASNPDKVRSPEFIQKLTAAYRDSPDADIRVRRYVALMLGEMKERSAVPLLVEGLSRDEKLKSMNWDSSGFMQWFRPSMAEIHDELVQNQIYTLWALGSIGDNSAVPGVLEHVRNQDVSVRKTVAYVLGVLQDPQALEQLRVMLNDSKDEVRWSAALALARLNDSEGAELLMKMLDESYVSGLEGMTPGQKSELRANAVTGLGILRHEPARKTIEALSQDDSALVVRNAALEALKKF